MPRSIRRYALLSGVAFCALLVGPIAGAQASDSTIIKTFNFWAPKLVHDESAVKAGLTAYKHSKFKPLVRALRHEVGDLHTLQRDLSHETASSAKGREAKAKIVTGLGLIAKAYGMLAREVRVSRGHGVPAAQLEAVAKTDKKGRAALKSGVKLFDS